MVHSCYYLYVYDNPGGSQSHERQGGALSGSQQYPCGAVSNKSSSWASEKDKQVQGVGSGTGCKEDRQVALKEVVCNEVLCMLGDSAPGEEGGHVARAKVGDRVGRSKMTSESSGVRARSTTTRPVAM